MGSREIQFGNSRGGSSRGGGHVRGHGRTTPPYSLCPTVILSNQENEPPLIWTQPQRQEPASGLVKNYGEIMTGLEYSSMVIKKARIESALRALKICFGFVSSIILIVLIQPFREPLHKLLKKVQQKILGPSEVE